MSEAVRYAKMRAGNAFYQWGIVCADCGRYHETGAQALECDHERGIERWAALVGGLHSRNDVRGCPLCEQTKEG